MAMNFKLVARNTSFHSAPGATKAPFERLFRGAVGWEDYRQSREVRSSRMNQKKKARRSTDSIDGLIRERPLSAQPR